MANEKKENVTPAQKPDLTKEVKFRRRRYEMRDEKTNELKIGEYVECTTKLKGEEVRFKVDKKDSKLVRVLMRMYGYPLYDLDGESIVDEEDIVEL